jgi:hypothetical protein
MTAEELASIIRSAVQGDEYGKREHSSYKEREEELSLERDYRLIGEVFHLPKLQVLNSKNLGNMIAKMYAALQPLRRRSPDTLRSTKGDLLIRVLNLLPYEDRTFFLTTCQHLGVPADFQNLLGYLEACLRPLEDALYGELLPGEEFLTKDEDGDLLYD